MLKRIFAILIGLACLVQPFSATAFSLSNLLGGDRRTIGFVPQTADNIGAELDAQILRWLGPSGYGRDSVSIAVTSPADLGDLDRSSPLARQMSEELSRYFIEMGYQVDEIRKSNEIAMYPERGEFALTREVPHLQDRNIHTRLLLVGTYTTTDRSVRFNMRLISATGLEVYAQAGGTVPITPELAPLVKETYPQPLGPSVQTRLPR